MIKIYSEEKEAWISFKNGDERAYEYIYSSYFKKLYNYGHKYSSDSTFIEDAIHDLFLKLWKNRENLGSPESVKNYLFKAFRFQIFDKNAVAQRYVLGSGEEDFDDYLFDFNLSPEADLIEGEKELELKQKLAQAISTLTPRQREIIFLRYYEEFTYPEIAEIMNLSVKGTYKLLARAISALRETTTAENVMILLFHVLKQL